MAKIQPITTFFNGKNVEVNNIEVRSIGDNLSLEPLKGQATLYYELQSITTTTKTSTIEKVIYTEIPTIIETPSYYQNMETMEKTEFIEKVEGFKTVESIENVETIEDVTTTENVITATLELTGADYDSWNSDPTSNAWALNWAANKLNLILI